MLQPSVDPPSWVLTNPPPAKRTNVGPKSDSKTASDSYDLGDAAGDAKDILTGVAAAGSDFFDAWKDFAMRRDILQTATGFMIGGALTSIVNSLVQDVLTPLVSAAWQGTDAFDGAFLVLRHGVSVNITGYLTPEEAQADGAVTLNYGKFLSTLLDFFIMSLLVFLIFRLLRRLQKTADAAASSVKQSI